MNWEALSAISTFLTAAIIAITAVAAFRELRLTADSTRAAGEQITELRKATQFEGTLEVFKELDSQFQRDARHFVQFELEERMQDDAFRGEVTLLSLADETRHHELTVLRCFERIGFYLSKGFVEKDLVYLVASGRTIVMWRALAPVLEIHRVALGSSQHPWQNFEALYYATMAHMRDQGMAIRADASDAPYRA